jgi:hypothetical protein
MIVPCRCLIVLYVKIENPVFAANKSKANKVQQQQQQPAQQSPSPFGGVQVQVPSGYPPTWGTLLHSNDWDPKGDADWYRDYGWHNMSSTAYWDANTSTWIDPCGVEFQQRSDWEIPN